MNTSKLAQLALLTSLALIFGYIESLFPLPVPIPGIKLGISNIVILFALLRLGKGSAFLIMTIKVTLSSLLFGGITTLIYSFSGGILSLAVMSLFKNKFSIPGISMLGGIFHNTGQLAAAAAVLKSSTVFYWYPPLILSGLILGFIIGTICSAVIKRLSYTP